MKIFLMWVILSVVGLFCLAVLLEPLARKAWHLFVELDESEKDETEITNHKTKE